MMRKLLKSKIHRATVTAADLHYEGSITLPPSLMKASNIAPFEAVHVWDVTNGSRLQTYAMLGQEPKEGERAEICINGAAAHLVKAGDLVIIASYCLLDEIELAHFKPTIVFVDEKNAIKELRPENPGPHS